MRPGDEEDERLGGRGGAGLGPDHRVGGEVGEAAGGVGGVAGQHRAARHGPGVGLDIPVHALLHTVLS